MQGHTAVIDCLKELLRGELAARDQYFIHSRQYEDQGFVRLYERLNHEMQEETEHADAILRRILMLEGKPDMRPHAFTPGESVTFRFTGADGARVRDISVAVPAGAGTMGELLSALNNPVTGVGRYGAFSLDGAGALTFKSYDSSGSTLSVVRDTTSQVPSGVTMSNLFGLGGGVRAARTEGFSVRQDIQSNPSKLALAQLNLSAAAGTPALSVPMWVIGTF